MCYLSHNQLVILMKCDFVNDCVKLVSNFLDKNVEK